MTDGSTTWSYTYDANGMRIGCTDGTTSYQYVYNGSQLSQMTVGSDILRFSYDSNGKPMSVTLNGSVYYYITNTQGDVIAILDAAGTAVATYSYDAWGNIINEEAIPTGIGQLNPLRYRSYVYDPEIGYYYLESRYYNPETGRFLNADKYVFTGEGLLGHNMFAYCNNNPIAFVDTHGTFAWIVALCIIGGAAIIGGIIGATSDTKLGENARNENTNVPQIPTKPNATTHTNIQKQAESVISSPESIASNIQQKTKLLTTGDRVKNTLTGAALGLLVGGAVVAVGGAGMAIAGVAAGMQVFAIGALAVNSFAMVIAPFFGIEMEPIEVTP